MIAVRPGRPAFDVLALVVAHPGQLDAAAIGQRLWRPRVTGTADYLRVRAAIVSHAGDWTSRAAGLLHRLQQQALVERVRPPQVAEEWAELAAVEGTGPREVVEAAADTEGPPDPSGLRVALLADLVRRAPATVAAWVGDAPAGHVQRAVADLVEWGVVVPPSRRWPTPDGVALVDRLGGAHAPVAPRGGGHGVPHAALPCTGAA